MTAYATTSGRRDFAITVLRVAIGIIFFMHGWQKVFANGIGQTTQFFAGLGIPVPEMAAPFVALLELIGGVLLILGAFTRPIAVLLAFDMFVALVLVHLRQGFFLPRGYEFVLILLAGCVTLALAGAGAFGLDQVLFRRRSRPV